MRSWFMTSIILLFRVIIAKHFVSPFSVAPTRIISRGYGNSRDEENSCYYQGQQTLTIMSGNTKNNNQDSNSNNEDETPIPRQQLVSGWENPDEQITDGGDSGGDDDASPSDDYCSLLDDFGCEAYEEFSKNVDDKVYRWIRLETSKAKANQGYVYDNDRSLLADVGIHSKADVIRKIDQVRKQQESFGPSQLYPRTWQNRWTPSSTVTATTSSDQQQLLVVNGDDGKRPPQQPSAVAASFSALQFNALAEGLSAGPNVKTPFPIKKKQQEKEIDGDKNNSNPKNQGYGGFSLILSPEICLDFSMRRWRLLEVLLGVDSSTPQSETEKDDVNFNNNDGMFDILALEEIDRFHGFFAPVLKLFGYKGIFMPKAKSPGVTLGYYSDGCALFWKTSVFEVLSEERLQYKVGNQVIILATLKHIQSGKPILVVVTHLKAQKSEGNEKIRCVQVEELLGYIQDSVDRQSESLGINALPVMVMGDFNADPPSEIEFPNSAIQRIISNHERDGAATSSSDKNKPTKPMRFQSAHRLDPPDAGFFTTWKTRGTHTVKRIIDYIFYSDQVTCTATLSVPTEHELEGNKLPGLRYPSDHLMIAGKFELHNNK